MRSRSIRAIACLIFSAATAWSCAPAEPDSPQTGGTAAEDICRISVSAEAADGPLTGRLIVMFITESGPEWDHRMPAAGPFDELPQPLAAMDVADLEPGSTVTLDDSAVMFPAAMHTFRGSARVQAVLDVDTTQRSHLQGPGNLISEIITVQFDPATSQTIELKLSRRIPGPAAVRPESDHLRWVKIRSELLSNFAGQDVMHEAGIALPPGYHDDPEARWPVVYVIPEFAGRHHGAVEYAEMFATRGIERVAPMAIHVVLDPECALGHHGFADSENNGPRGSALVQELIPHIEQMFRIDAQQKARIVTGHGAGGWAALWLQLQHPDVFGACWSTSPDPVAFMAMQMSNIYQDENLFTYAPGHETPGYIDFDAEDRPIVQCTQRQQAEMERLLHEDGTSGLRLDSWEARYSPRDSQTGLPQPLFDAATGEIDRDVAEHWKRFDLHIQIVRNWQTFGPTLHSRVRLMCGELDSYSFNRAVHLLQDELARMNRESPVARGDGYIEIVPDVTYHTLRGRVFARLNNEMRTYLRASGYGQ